MIMRPRGWTSLCLHLIPHDAERYRRLPLEDRGCEAVDVNVCREQVVNLGAVVRPLRQLRPDRALLPRVGGYVGVPQLHR